MILPSAVSLQQKAVWEAQVSRLRLRALISTALLLQLFILTKIPSASGQDASGGSFTPGAAPTLTPPPTPIPSSPRAFFPTPSSTPTGARTRSPASRPTVTVHFAGTGGNTRDEDESQRLLQIAGSVLGALSFLGGLIGVGLHMNRQGRTEQPQRKSGRGGGRGGLSPSGHDPEGGVNLMPEPEIAAGAVVPAQQPSPDPAALGEEVTQVQDRGMITQLEASGYQVSMDLPAVGHPVHPITSVTPVRESNYGPASVLDGLSQEQPQSQQGPPPPISGNDGGVAPSAPAPMSTVVPGEQSSVRIASTYSDKRGTGSDESVEDQPRPQDTKAVHQPGEDDKDAGLSGGDGNDVNGGVEKALPLQHGVPFIKLNDDQGHTSPLYSAFKFLPQAGFIHSSSTRYLAMRILPSAVLLQQAKAPLGMQVTRMRALLPTAPGLLLQLFILVGVPNAYGQDTTGLPNPPPLPTLTRIPRPTRTPIPRPTRTPIPRPTRTPIPRPTRTPIPRPSRTPIPRPPPLPSSSPSGSFGTGESGEPGSGPGGGYGIGDLAEIEKSAGVWPVVGGVLGGLGALTVVVAAVICIWTWRRGKKEGEKDPVKPHAGAVGGYYGPARDPEQEMYQMPTAAVMHSSLLPVGLGRELMQVQDGELIAQLQARGYQVNAAAGYVGDPQRAIMSVYPVRGNYGASPVLELSQEQPQGQQAPLGTTSAHIANNGSLSVYPSALAPISTGAKEKRPPELALGTSAFVNPRYAQADLESGEVGATESAARPSPEYGVAHQPEADDMGVTSEEKDARQDALLVEGDGEKVSLTQLQEQIRALQTQVVTLSHNQALVSSALPVSNPTQRDEPPPSYGQT
ncbi:hypothetical protein FA15DRAFT_717257 [Coprinopsis marcescibilis]|uniref:Uncharacterized protein n=1 Tax=Coprinopsis marcescibilis TaxID=230819 RepID=A0A5C3KM54_COPMA|nr:hypothetical protein FA15DRAFT_717257 [Coprinopsis marcescibilis]